MRRLLCAAGDGGTKDHGGGEVAVSGGVVLGEGHAREPAGVGPGALLDCRPVEGVRRRTGVRGPHVVEQGEVHGGSFPVAELHLSDGATDGWLGQLRLSRS